jgi:hypothetical protein
MYIANSNKQENFKANSVTLALYMKGINPPDEIKGSNSSPSALFSALANTMESHKSKIPPNRGNLKA